MAGLPERELNFIAAVTAKELPAHLREDCYQSAWERFVRYRPRTRAGAWLMASHARADLYRSEARQRATSLEALALRAPGIRIYPLEPMGRWRRYVPSEAERARSRAKYHRRLEHYRALVRERVRRHRAAH